MGCIGSRFLDAATGLMYMEDVPQSRIGIPAIIVSAILFIGVFIAFQSSKSRPGTIVLPGGITYLGPTPTTQATDANPPVTGGKIPIAQDPKWVKRKGTMFPYSFSYPETLSLGVFPDDPYDAITIFYPGTEANANIFFRVEDLNRLNKKQYIGKTEEYSRIWWKDYNWKGVASVSAFTNTNGLRGYRATYINDRDKTPYDHVFFEVPGRDDALIWISGKLFTQEIFDTMVDSVEWKNN